MSFQPTVIPSGENYINSTAIFSGIDKSIISKDFKGGKIVNVFGSTELDFTQADMNGMAVLDISQAFGEMTITIPADWCVETDISQLMAVVDDYRNNKYQKNLDKVLVLKGRSVCANLEIWNDQKDR